MAPTCKSKVNCVSCFTFSAGYASRSTVSTSALSGQPQRLLGVLLAERDRVVSTDLLVERLWPDEAPATASKVVHVLVGRLRRALEPELTRASDSRVIRKASGGYGSSTGPTDLDRYLELVEAAVGR